MLLEHRNMFQFMSGETKLLKEQSQDLESKFQSRLNEYNIKTMAHLSDFFSKCVDQSTYKLDLVKKADK